MSFLLATATCLLGTLVSHQVAAVTAAILLALAVAAFTLHRAGLLLDTILAEEPATPGTGAEVPKAKPAPVGNL